MTSTTRVLLCGAAILSAATTIARADGTATGTLTVAGKAAKLAFVYASPEPDPFDKKREVIRITLSDVALTPTALADPFELQKLTKAGKLHAVVAMVDQTKAVISTMLYDASFNFDSVSVAGTNNKFDAETFSSTSVAGKLYTQKPDTFGMKDVKFEFSATFNATIARKAAAVASAAPKADDPVVVAVMAYMKAAGSADAVAIKRTIVPAAAKDLDGPQGKQILEMLKLMFPPNSKVTAVEVQGDTAKVTVESNEGATTSTSKLSLQRVAGAWKVNPQG